jgi:hypothetical protein
VIPPRRQAVDQIEAATQSFREVPAALAALAELRDPLKSPPGLDWVRLDRAIQSAAAAIGVWQRIHPPERRFGSADPFASCRGRG